MRILFEVIGTIVGLPLIGLFIVWLIDIVFGTSILGGESEASSFVIIIAMWAASALVAFGMGWWGYRLLKGSDYEGYGDDLAQAKELKKASGRDKKEAAEDRKQAKAERAEALKALDQARAAQIEADTIQREIQKGPSVNDPRNVPEVTVEELTIEAHVQKVETWITDAQEDESKLIRGKLHGQIVRLLNLVIVVFKAKGLLAPERLITVPKDVDRIDQIETLIDLYSEKIRNVENDPNIDDEMRATKIDYWRRLLETDVARLEAG